MHFALAARRFRADLEDSTLDVRRLVSSASFKVAPGGSFKLQGSFSKSDVRRLIARQVSKVAPENSSHDGSSNTAAPQSALTADVTNTSKKPTDGEGAQSSPLEAVTT